MRTSLLFLLLLAQAAFAQKAAAQAPQTFESYKMVRMRNIFDPARLPMPTAGPVVHAVVTAPPKASDYVALTGIMVTSDTAIAFFSGSRPDYEKVLTLNGDIVGAKVTKITPNSIEVDRSGKKVVIAVGQTVPFDTSAPAVAPVPVAPTPDSTLTTPAAPAGMSDVMRRMMERRQQQLK